MTDTKVDIEAITEMYLELRNLKEVSQKQFDAQLAPVKEKMIELENLLLEEMERRGVDSLPNPAGTPYTKVTYSVTVGDWLQSLRFIQHTQKWDLLNRALNKTAVLDALNEGIDVPGANITAIKKVLVRKR